MTSFYTKLSEAVSKGTALVGEDLDTFNELFEHYKKIFGWTEGEVAGLTLTEQ
jgi:hypothetical protein